MATSPRLVKQLIEALARTAKESLDHKGFEIMSDYIEKKTKVLVTQKYLYETYRKVCADDIAGKKEVRVFEDKLDTISRAMGYERFLHFVQGISRPIDPQLKTCAGSWWSIVRANAGPYILKAPLRIYEEDMNMLIELQGGQRLFKGTVMLRAANLFCELDTGRDKKLYIVMKAGTTENPLLLQGVFAGISSAGDPIAGRELFLRETKIPFEEMKWEKIAIEENTLDQRINKYFNTYEKNCMKINKVSTFSMSDLDE